MTSITYQENDTLPINVSKWSKGDNTELKTNKKKLKISYTLLLC